MDVPFFLRSIDEDSNFNNHIWKFTLLGGMFIGNVVWCQRDVNAIPILVSIQQNTHARSIVEIPWTAIQCITYEGTKSD